MTNFVSKAAGLVLATGVMCAVTAAPLAAEQRISKDSGPQSAACDQFSKGTAAWTGCVGQASRAMAKDELFYAGYWLAKSGQYAQAIQYLSLADQTDARVLTYIGFATRKMGDVDAALPLYRQALGLNPDYVVARAYLGEAFLSLDEPAKATAELAEIERRCGSGCAAYADLKQHIDAYRASPAKG
jgi:tetratricopeptide (TPR) repeat protein